MGLGLAIGMDSMPACKAYIACVGRLGRALADAFHGLRGRGRLRVGLPASLETGPGDARAGL